jgi:hypothetical protein
MHACRRIYVVGAGFFDPPPRTSQLQTRNTPATTCSHKPPLKGLSHEIFFACFLPVCIHFGLNVNRFWFLNFNNVPSILNNYLKFWCVSGQTFSEIHRISEKDLQESNISQRTANKKSIKIGDPRAQLAIKVWPEMHQKLKWLSQIEATSLQFKNQKRFLFWSRYIYSGQKKN